MYNYTAWIIKFFLGFRLKTKAKDISFKANVTA